jgi:hypothetical protein
MAKTTIRAIPEPIWEGEQVCSKFVLIETLTWYSENKSEKDARAYLLSYLSTKLTKEQKQAAQFLNPMWYQTEGFVARCLSRGAKIPENSFQTFHDGVQKFIARLDAIVIERDLSVPTTATPEPTNVISIQERVQNKVDYYIMELEGKFDDVWHRNSTEEFVPYTWMMENGVKPMHATKIAEYFRERAKAWVDMIGERKTDEYVKESYPRSTKEYLQGANILASIMNDADKLAANKNAAKKPRKKKAIPLEKKVAKLNFKKDDMDNKLISINPVKIMGAEKLWIYNVKTRKLGVYVAADGAGLGVKGSAIENYKYSESIAKTLRKPEAVLKKVLEGGKIVLRKVMEGVNSKPSELNGRINKDTILLRVE